jgi:8-oxo-dGTP pyrophosphatase MutT (NUDIX family)
MGFMSEAAKGSRQATRQERSAGVIVYRDAPGGKRLYLLLDYGRYWDYPKGHVEAGEDDITAALRELHEETAIRDVQLVPGFTHEIVYYFRTPRGKLVRKSVVFFLASTTNSRVRLSEEHVGYEWLNAEDALARLKYATARKVFRAVLTQLYGDSTPR